MVPAFKNVGERSTAKNHHPVSLLSVVSKVCEELVNKRLVDHLEKYFQYGFRSSRSTAELLTVVYERIPRAFNRSGATRAVALDISKAFHRFWHHGLLHKLMEFQVRYLALFLLFSVIDAGSPFNYRFFLNKFPACFNLFVFCFLVTPCLVVAVQPCIE